MKRRNLKHFVFSLSFLAAFVLWTFAVRYIDVQPIGPNRSAVGFAAINGFVHKLTGTNMLLYTITDWLGLVPIFFCFGFGIFGLMQWICRRHIWKVDRSILILGIYYVAVAAVYILFEYVVINRRPVLINGILEASYPSSTTMLVMCVMPTAILQLQNRIRCKPLKILILCAIAGFTVFMVVGRFLSGVHWLTDIVGGALFSAGMVMLYAAVCKKT